jgi:hypothetical protein
MTKCEYCEQEISNKDYYYIYCLVVETKEEVHFVGLDTLIKNLSNYLMEKRCHLSASQIILLRPDILKEYLKTLVTKEIERFYLKAYIVCYECFEQYKELVPLL